MGKMSAGHWPNKKDIRICVAVLAAPGAFRDELIRGMDDSEFRPRDTVEDARLILVDLSSRRLDPARMGALRATRDCPILTIGERDDWAQEIATLRAGADDYVSRPVVMPALLERMRKHLRVYAVASGDDLSRGALEMNSHAHEVTWRGQPVALTHTEFRLLQALACRPGHVKTREQLLDLAHRDHEEAEDRVIDSHIKRLRRKLRRVDPGFSAIETLYGIGYRLSCEELHPI